MYIKSSYFLFLLLALTLTAGTPWEDNSGDEEQKARIAKEYNIHSLPLPTHLTLGGESVPLEDHDVRERLDRELLVNTYWQSNTLLLIKRADRYMPEMKKIFEEEQVPTDLTYLGLIESGFQNVVSPAGATGFWQFMESTGKEYGLIIDDEVDERYHVQKSTRAAAQYLKEAHDKFGSWTLAAASYNMGMNGVSRQLARQKVNNYYDLLLNSETSRYVFRILAIKEILEHQNEYGFHVREDDLYHHHEFVEIPIDSTIEDLAQFALDKGINYKTLKVHNPWLREASLQNRNKRVYSINIPVSKSVNSTEE